MRRRKKGGRGDRNTLAYWTRSNNQINPTDPVDKVILGKVLLTSCSNRRNTFAACRILMYALVTVVLGHDKGDGGGRHGMGVCQILIALDSEMG